MAIKISAIIPLHNKSFTIERACKSVLAQSAAVHELVVVDDCCSDDSVEKLESVSTKNLRVYHRDTRGPGGYAARNLGAQMANGDWLSFLDADDTWDHDHIASAKEIIRDNPSVTSMFFGRRVKRGSDIRDIRVQEARIYSFEELLKFYSFRNIFHINSLVIRRDIYLASGGFDLSKDWRRGGDSEFFLRLIRDAGPVFVSPKVTTLYDTNCSEIIGNPKNFVDEHPVHHTAAEMIRENPGYSSDLKRLANRKTLEWLREMGNDNFGKKLSLLRSLYFTHMSGRDWYKLFRDFNRQHNKHFS